LINFNLSLNLKKLEFVVESNPVICLGKRGIIAGKNNAEIYIIFHFKKSILRFFAGAAEKIKIPFTDGTDHDLLFYLLVGHEIPG